METRNIKRKTKVATPLPVSIVVQEGHQKLGITEIGQTDTGSIQLVGHELAYGTVPQNNINQTPKEAGKIEQTFNGIDRLLKTSCGKYRWCRALIGVTTYLAAVLTFTVAAIAALLKVIK